MICKIYGDLSCALLYNTYGTLSQIGPLHPDAFLFVYGKVPRSQSESGSGEQTSSHFLFAGHVHKTSLLSDGNKHIRKVGQEIYYPAAGRR